MKKRFIIDQTTESICIFGNTQKTVLIASLTEQQQSTIADFQNLCESFDVAPVAVIGLKKAVLYKTFIVVIGDNDKTVTKELTELSSTQVAPLNELLSVLGQEVTKIEYTKASNLISINGDEMQANALNATPLLDNIETICIELLNA